MILAVLLLATGLIISAVAIYYSVIGLAAIFAAATIPIYIMGGSLEVAKLVCAAWLKANWDRTPVLMKVYMTTAVLILMFITSMGIFGFLSQAHSDQSLVSGDVQSKIAIYDEKIKTARENIDANRKALKQMDEAVDQVMARSSSETGADRAVAIRRSQLKERARLQSEIQAEQKTISSLSQERAPIAAEVRKVEAEVGPIKYIAKLIYGDNPDANLLEKAVTWVIILIVAVFDPLAVIMLLAAQMTFVWIREQKNKVNESLVPAPAYEPDDGPLTDEQITQIKETAPSPTQSVVEKSIFEQHPYLNQPFAHFKNLEPMVYKVEDTVIADKVKEDPIPCHKCGTDLVNAPGIGLFCPNKACEGLIWDDRLELDFVQPLPVEKTVIIEPAQLETDFPKLEDNEAAEEAAKWAQEQIDDSKKKTKYIIKQQNQQVKKTKE